MAVTPLPLLYVSLLKVYANMNLIWLVRFEVSAPRLDRGEQRSSGRYSASRRTDHGTTSNAVVSHRAALFEQKNTKYGSS